MNERYFQEENQQIQQSQTIPEINILKLPDGRFKNVNYLNGLRFLRHAFISLGIICTALGCIEIVFLPYFMKEGNSIVLKLQNVYGFPIWIGLSVSFNFALYTSYKSFVSGLLIYHCELLKSTISMCRFYISNCINFILVVVYWIIFIIYESSSQNGLRYLFQLKDGTEVWRSFLKSVDLDENTAKVIDESYHQRIELLLIRTTVATLSLFMIMCDLLVAILYTKPVLSYDRIDTYHFRISYPCRGCCVYERTRHNIEHTNLMSNENTFSQQNIMPDDVSSMTSDATTTYSQIGQRNQFLAWILGDPIARRTVSRHDQIQ